MMPPRKPLTLPQTLALMAVLPPLLVLYFVGEFFRKVCDRGADLRERLEIKFVRKSNPYYPYYAKNRKK